MSKIVKCITGHLPFLVEGEYYEVKKEFPAIGPDGPFYKIKGNSSKCWNQSRFEVMSGPPFPKPKFVKCIDNNFSSSLQMGQIYEVLFEKSVDGQPGFQIEGLDGVFYQSRFEDYDEPTVPTSQELAPLDAKSKTKRYQYSRAKLHARLDDLITHLHEATVIGNDKTLNQHEEELDTVAFFLRGLLADILTEKKE